MDISQIFRTMTRNVVKWWQLQIMPRFNLDNNARRGAADPIIHPNPQMNQMPVEPPKPVKVGGEDAMEVLNRINKEKEEARIQAILKARKEAEEKARIAAIMNANKVDVDSFIQAGKDAAEHQEGTGAQASAGGASATDSNVQVNAADSNVQVNVADSNVQVASADEEAKKQEELRRAQEIIDRLNREAAEDEAKKEAELEAAKQMAAEKFG